MKKKKTKIKVTLQDVLEMTQKGFEKVATKDDIARLEGRMDTLESKMTTTENAIERIENNHERRIEILEDDVRVLKTTVQKH